MKIMKMKKILSIVLVLALLPALMFPSSELNANLAGATTATVLQVFDGDALQVRLADGQTAQVRMAGIDSLGRGDARDFISNSLLGRQVQLLPSAAAGFGARFDSRWSPVYVSVGDTVYNRLLVQHGMAMVDRENYAGHWLYSLLTADENRARSARHGIWEQGFGGPVLPGTVLPPGMPGTLPPITPSAPGILPPISPGVPGTPGWGFFGERININTASTTQLNQFFRGSSVGNIGHAIVRTRNNSPFARVEDVVFAGNFDRRDFRRYGYMMTVSTNINTASERELQQLDGVGIREARNIIRSRQTMWFESVYRLRDEELITPRAFDENRPFISVTDEFYVVAAVPNAVADINTSSAYELERAGLTSAQAQAVVRARVNGYTFKTLGEISNLQNVTLNDRRINELADNLRVSGPAEGFAVPRVNINTATRMELMGLGLNDTQINQVISRRGRINSAQNLPFDVSAIDARVSLFTNVNTASAEEWMSLSTDISPAFASFLVFEARYAPFGTFTQIRDVFEEEGFGNTFSRIRRFLVLR